MNYELRWYVVTDRCLRVRGGILNVHEITTTFANIQEVRLSSGPLQKLLGLADVEVHSAGGGSGKGSSDSHVARFEGVDNAPEIRDFILVRLRQYRDSGLGEKDHSSPSVKPRSSTGGPDGGQSLARSFGPELSASLPALRCRRVAAATSVDAYFRHCAQHTLTACRRLVHVPTG